MNHSTALNPDTKTWSRPALVLFCTVLNPFSGRLVTWYPPPLHLPPPPFLWGYNCLYHCCKLTKSVCHQQRHKPVSAATCISSVTPIPLCNYLIVMYRMGIFHSWGPISWAFSIMKLPKFQYAVCINHGFKVILLLSYYKCTSLRLFQQVSKLLLCCVLWLLYPCFSWKTVHCQPHQSVLKAGGCNHVAPYSLLFQVGKFNTSSLSQ